MLHQVVDRSVCAYCPLRVVASSPNWFGLLFGGGERGEFREPSFHHFVNCPEAVAIPILTEQAPIPWNCCICILGLSRVYDPYMVHIGLFDIPAI